MKLITNTPIYEHTIPDSMTTFLASFDGKDFYYRYNGMEHRIDVRHSNEQSDYTNWTIVDSKGHLKKSEFMTSIIPEWIQHKAIECIDVSF